MATPVPDTCSAVNNILIQETGRINGEINKRIVRRNPIIGLIPKKEFPTGMGYTISNLTFERALPASSEDTWTPVAPSDDNSNINSCLPPVEDIGFGETLRTFFLTQKAFETPDFCIQDIQVSYQFERQVERMIEILTKVTEWEIGNHYLNKYVQICQHKLTVSSTGVVDNGSASFDTTVLPNGRLTQGVLEDIYMYLFREGTDESAIGRVDGGDVYLLCTSAETSRDIVRSNPDIRQDIRYAFQGYGESNTLIQALGEARSYGGFKHLQIPYPPHYAFDGTKYVRVEPFVKVQTTKGFKWDLNPLYLAAPYELSYVFVSNVMYIDVFNQVSNVAGMTFNPNLDYLGRFTWVNEWHRQCNPDRTIGFFRAVMKDAAEPIHPELGWAILHANCGVDLALQDCYSPPATFSSTQYGPGAYGGYGGQSGYGGGSTTQSATVTGP